MFVATQQKTDKDRITVVVSPEKFKKQKTSVNGYTPTILKVKHIVEKL